MCPHCGAETSSLYAIVRTGPIFERWLHICPDSGPIESATYVDKADRAR